MDAVADRQGVGAGVLRHLQVIHRVPHHQGLSCRHAELVHELQEHLGMGLGKGLVRASGPVEEVAEARLPQGPIQADPALSRCHGQQVALRGKPLQHGSRPREQGRGGLVGHEKVAAILGPHGGALLGVRLGPEGGHRLVEPQPDDVACRLPAGRGPTQIPKGPLDAGDDAGLGVHEGPIPIEDHQLEALGQVPHRSPTPAGSAA